MSGRWFWLCSAACLFIYDCGGSGSRFAPKKPDPTKGTVTGFVVCADTGKPARFATIALLPSPGSTVRGSDSNSGPSDEAGETGLDGRFKIEAVAPGEYFAFATLTGYLDPDYGVDFDRVNSKANDNEQVSDVIDQWKEHMVEISVSAQHTTDLTIQIERGAEIAGTVTYDDGSPAIGMRFAIYRRNSKGAWLKVGGASGREFALEEKSDARGRFVVTNLPAGEYKVCTLIPGDTQESSPQVCLGNVFRRRDANTISANPGETVSGADIVIPLNAIHAVSGSLAQTVASQPPVQAKLRLLYADDREVAMSTSAFSDGTFLFPFVPEGTFILEVSEASYTEPAPTAGSADAAGKTSPKVHEFATRELPITVQGADVSDLSITLVELPRAKSAPK